MRSPLFFMRQAARVGHSRKTGTLTGKADEKTGPFMRGAGHSTKNIELFTTGPEPVIFKLENTAGGSTPAACKRQGMGSERSPKERRL